MILDSAKIYKSFTIWKLFSDCDFFYYATKRVADRVGKGNLTLSIFDSPRASHNLSRLRENRSTKPKQKPCLMIIQPTSTKKTVEMQ